MTTGTPLKTEATTNAAKPPPGEDSVHEMVRPALLPCPFCGEVPNYRPRIQGPVEHGPGAYWPESVACNACMIVFRRGERGTEDPVARWNTRQPNGKVSHD